MSEQTCMHHDAAKLDDHKEPVDDETLHGHTVDKVPEDFKTDVEHAEFEPDYPDGGLRAWSVVFGASCLAFSSFGFTNSYGVFQAYYGETLLPTTSQSAIAWIGSIQYALVFLPSLPTGRLLDLGHLKIPMATFGACFIASVFLVAECKTYWQLLLCQGIAVGTFAGFLFGPAISTVTHWFHKKRFMAQGCVAAGSSIGGTILPITTRLLLPRVGYPWTIRILGFILLFTVSLGNILVRRRLPPRPAKGGLIHWGEFKKPEFTLFVVAYNIILLGLYTPLTYFDVSSQNVGVSSNISFYFVSIANGSSLIGRIGGGLVADKMGAINTLVPLAVVGAAMTYCWPYVTSVPGLVVVAFIYGICAGAFVSLMVSPPSRMGGMEDVGRRIGMAIAFTAGGAVAGPPIAGAIRTSSGNFKAVGAYAGSMMLGGALLLVASRYAYLKQWKGKF